MHIDWRSYTIEFLPKSPLIGSTIKSPSIKPLFIGVRAFIRGAKKDTMFAICITSICYKATTLAIFLKLQQFHLCATTISILVDSSFFDQIRATSATNQLVLDIK